jgi:hypothetical protein
VGRLGDSGKRAAVRLPERRCEFGVGGNNLAKPIAVAAGDVGNRCADLFWLLNHPSELLAQLGQLGLVLRIGVYGGALPAILVEAAPPTVRRTAVALGYNVCYGLFGGLSSLVATWLVERAGSEIAPAFFIMASAAVTFVTIFYFQESYRTPFGVAPRTASAK